MSRMTGGQAVAASLKAEGVDHIFGIVGTHNCPLFDGVVNDPAFHVVTVRHEQGASLMAAGYARASGKIAACFVVPGPGLTNALTGMGMAYSESAPMFMFGGQNTLAQIDREGGWFHELNNSMEVARAVSGFAARAASASDVPKIVREAMRAMRCGRPRPAYVEMPLDVQAGEAEVSVLPFEQYSRPSGDPAAIERAAEALRTAKHPFIFAGGGVETAEASGELTRLAEIIGAPVVTSVYGRGAISDRHPLALGDGWGRVNHYEELLKSADLALVVGARIDIVSDVSLGANFPLRMIQVDLDPRVVGHRRTPEVGIVGDAKHVLAELVSHLESGQPRAPWFDVESFLRKRHAFLTERTGPVLDVVQDLRANTTDDTIFFDDLTLVGYWMPLLLETYQPRTYFHPGTYGTLGYSLPAAIGGKLACPKQPVISISGDGGFMFTVQELATAKLLNLDLVAIVFNDNLYGAIRTYQDRVLGGRRIGCDLANPDFVKLGDAFGVTSVRVDPKDLGSTVRKAQSNGGLWLIEVPFAPKGMMNVVPWMP